MIGAGGSVWRLLHKPSLSCNMVSIRISKEGWQFLSLLAGGGCACSLEYYLYYRYLPSATQKAFLSTPLPDKPEYGQEVVVSLGNNAFVFKHRGGTQAVRNVVRDTYDSSRFRRVLGLQFASMFATGLGLLKKKKAFATLAVAMSAANLIFGFPCIQSSVNLYRLAKLVEAGNEEVYENLSEIRFVQRIDESTSPLLRYSEQAGLGTTVLFGLYLAPFLTVFSAGIVWVYLRSQKSVRPAP